MKITDPAVIKNGEKDLIEAVKADLDMASVQQIIQKKMNGAALTSRGGEIVVYNNQIAFRLDFDIHLKGSLMFDRQGNYIPESTDSDEIDSLAAEDLDMDQPLEDELDIDLPEYDLEDLDEIPEDPDTASEPKIPEDDLLQEDLIEDDIDDILKESRDFWEQKKEP